MTVSDLLHKLPLFYGVDKIYINNKDIHTLEMYKYITKNVSKWYISTENNKISIYINI